MNHMMLSNIYYSSQYSWHHTSYFYIYLKILYSSQVPSGWYHIRITHTFKSNPVTNRRIIFGKLSGHQIAYLLKNPKHLTKIRFGTVLLINSPDHQ